MKKLIFLVACSVMSLAFVGCTTDEGITATEPPMESMMPTETPNPVPNDNATDGVVDDGATDGIVNDGNGIINDGDAMAPMN